MSITTPQQYVNLMNASQKRIFAFLANEVGMKRAKEIAKRVLSDEPMPEEVVLLDMFGGAPYGHVTVNLSVASGDDKIRDVVLNGARDVMGVRNSARG